MMNKKLVGNILDMFDFLHDVITDINTENEEWNKTFHEEFDEIRLHITEELEAD